MFDELRALGVRVELDERDETLGKKIRDAQTAKVAYQLVIGDKELSGQSVSVRKHGEKELTTMPWAEFKAWLVQQIADRV